MCVLHQPWILRLLPNTVSKEIHLWLFSWTPESNYQFVFTLLSLIFNTFPAQKSVHRNSTALVKIKKKVCLERESLVNYFAGIIHSVLKEEIPLVYKNSLIDLRPKQFLTTYFEWAVSAHSGSAHTHNLHFKPYSEATLRNASSVQTNKEPTIDWILNSNNSLAFCACIFPQNLIWCHTWDLVIHS